MTLRPVAALLVGMIAVVLSIGACSSEDGEAERAPLVVEDFRYRLLPGGARIISGSLHNPTEAAIRSAQIQVSLFDADNQKVAEMVIAVQNIAPGESKSFREPVDADGDVQAARVRSVLVL